MDPVPFLFGGYVPRSLATIPSRRHSLAESERVKQRGVSPDRERNAEYYAAHRESEKQKFREWWAKNKDRQNAKRRAKRTQELAGMIDKRVKSAEVRAAQRKAYLAAYYQIHKAEILARKATRAAARREKA